MCEQDGVDYLIRTIRVLTEDRARDDILFVFMGGGPAQSAIVQYAKELGVSQHCHFTGYVPDEDINRYLSTTDVAVDPDPKTIWSDKQYCGHILGCLLINDAVIAKGFVLWTGFVQTLPIG